MYFGDLDFIKNKKQASVFYHKSFINIYLLLQYYYFLWNMDWYSCFAKLSLSR